MMKNKKDAHKSSTKSPLSAMASMDFAAFESEDNLNHEQNLTHQIEYIDPDLICNWMFHDRPQNELGNIDSLAKEFLDPEIGQKQPCIVRPSKDKRYTYEVIAGERRWRAAKLAKTKLAVIVQELDNSQAAYCQIAENHNRKTLSDHSIGMSFAKLIYNDFLKQKDLQEKFNLSPVQINRLLSFSQLPLELINTIGDMSKISARTAAEMRSLLKKGQQYEKAIFELAPKIRTGKIGEKLLKKEVNKIINNETPLKISARKFLNKEKKSLFSVKETGRNTKIEIPNNILDAKKRSQLYRLIKDYLCE